MEPASTDNLLQPVKVWSNQDTWFNEAKRMNYLKAPTYHGFDRDTYISRHFGLDTGIAVVCGECGEERFSETGNDYLCSECRDAQVA